MGGAAPKKEISISVWNAFFILRKRTGNCLLSGIAFQINFARMDRRSFKAKKPSSKSGSIQCLDFVDRVSFLMPRSIPKSICLRWESNRRPDVINKFQHRVAALRWNNAARLVKNSHVILNIQLECIIQHYIVYDIRFWAASMRAQRWSLSDLLHPRRHLSVYLNSFWCWPIQHVDMLYSYLSVGLLLELPARRSLKTLHKGDTIFNFWRVYEWFVE